MKTAMGQAMDLLSAPGAGEKPDLSQFTTDKYGAIVKYKTAYYSFYLPVALAMHMVGNFLKLKLASVP
jgi:farnesyl diphosphate synthase